MSSTAQRGLEEANLTQPGLDLRVESSINVSKAGGVAIGGPDTRSLRGFGQNPRRQTRPGRGSSWGRQAPRPVRWDMKKSKALPADWQPALRHHPPHSSCPRRHSSASSRTRQPQGQRAPSSLPRRSGLNTFFKYSGRGGRHRTIAVETLVTPGDKPEASVESPLFGPHGMSSAKPFLLGDLNKYQPQAHVSGSVIR